MLKMALGLTLGVMVAAPAFAQDQFSDVPANHWAYDSIANLKAEGILVGYPDYKYRGARLATRYEMAVAINAAYTKLMRMIDGLSEKIGTGGGDGVTSEQLNELKAQIEEMKGWGTAIDDLKKLVNEFESELTGIGNDVDEMKKRLGSLEGRVKVLEDKQFPVDISGDVNFLVYAGNSRDKRAGMNKEGRLVGVNEKGGNSQTGLTRDLNVYHEIGINLKGTNTEGPKWNATIAYGNMYGNSNAAGNAGVLADLVNFPANGTGYTDNIQGAFRIDKAAVNFDTSLVGLKFNAEIGRVGVKVAPYILQRADDTLYFANERWDDGEYRMDGAKLVFDFSGVDFVLVGGKNSGRNDSANVDINPIAGAFVDTTLGAVLGFNVGTFGKLNLAYLYHDSDTAAAATTPNRMNTFGVDGNAKFGNINLKGGYTKTILTHNSKNIGLDRLNQAAYLNAGYDSSNWGVSGEFRKVQMNFGAPGDWRRIGTFWNPTNFQSITAMAYFKPTANVKLSYTGEFGETREAVAGIPAKSKIESHIANVDYTLNSSWNVGLGYEEVRVKLAGPDIRQRWATVGFGYKLGTNSLLNFAYEYGSVRQPATWGNASASGADYRGGFLTTQLTVRF